MHKLICLITLLAVPALATEGVPEQTIITSDSAVATARLTLGYHYIRCIGTNTFRLEASQTAAENEDGSGIRLQAGVIWPFKVLGNARWIGVRSVSGASGCYVYATDNPNPSPLGIASQLQFSTVQLDGAGIGTATVASGSVCVCSGASTTLHVACQVSGTTLSLAGFAGDTASYICVS